MFSTQQKWGIDSNMEKTLVLLDLHGRGSQKAARKIGGHIQLSDGRQLRVASKAKYLGVEIGEAQDGLQREVGMRVKNAQEAMSRLGVVWRLRVLSISKKKSSCTHH